MLVPGEATSGATTTAARWYAGRTSATKPSTSMPACPRSAATGKRSMLRAPAMTCSVTPCSSGQHFLQEELHRHHVRPVREAADEQQPPRLRAASARGGSAPGPPRWAAPPPRAPSTPARSFSDITTTRSTARHAAVSNWRQRSNSRRSSQRSRSLQAAAVHRSNVMSCSTRMVRAGAQSAAYCAICVNSSCAMRRPPLAHASGAAPRGTPCDANSSTTLGTAGDGQGVTAPAAHQHHLRAEVEQFRRRRRRPLRERHQHQVELRRRAPHQVVHADRAAVRERKRQIRARHQDARPARRGPPGKHADAAIGQRQEQLLRIRGRRCRAPIAPLAGAISSRQVAAAPCARTAAVAPAATAAGTPRASRTARARKRR